jgi:DNA replication initiation complex subunit (GINS family)
MLLQEKSQNASISAGTRREKMTNEEKNQVLDIVANAKERMYAVLATLEVPSDTAAEGSAWKDHVKAKKALVKLMQSVEASALKFRMACTATGQ